LGCNEHLRRQGAGDGKLTISAKPFIFLNLFKCSYTPLTMLGNKLGLAKLLKKKCFVPKLAFHDLAQQNS
jgi:hypothetical protein